MGRRGGAPVLQVALRTTKYVMSRADGLGQLFPCLDNFDGLAPLDVTATMQVEWMHFRAVSGLASQHGRCQIW
jgi:hypothetical protein